MNRSFWLRQALGSESTQPPLTQNLDIDVCIVGGGFTGLWTAINLKQRDPSVEIAIIEKDICGGGASGRNGGFCMTWMSKATSLLKATGGQEGVRLLRESENAVTAIGEFCLANQIDCQFRHDGWVWTASNDSQMGSWSETIEKLDKLGLHPYEVLDTDALSSLTGSQSFTGGVLERGVATVQPALLARGLRRVALDRGVKIFENTPMKELIRSTPPKVRIKGGTITADCVVLALNAWAHELPEFRRTVLPIAADVIATEPVPEKLEAMGLKGCTAVSDSRILVNFYRPTVDGRMVWGVGGGAIPFAGRLGTRFDDMAPRSGRVEQHLVRFHPELASTKIEYAWRGPATRTSTGLPLFGTLPGAERIVYGHGYVGNGVGPCYLSGKILSSLVLRQKDEWSETPLVNGPVGKKLPPEPIRYVGSQFVRAASMRVDQAQDDGRKPSRLDHFLASLGPAGLSPVKEAE